MIQRVRELLTLTLIGLFPFHAFLVTVLTKLIEGAGNPPMEMLAVWKEGVLGVVLVLAVIEILKKLRATLRQAQSRLSYQLRADSIDLIIITLFILGIVTSAFSPKPEARSFLYGFRYDFIPLIAFLFLRRVSWSEEFFIRLQKVILSVGVLVAGYGIISFFLPASFFHALGYSDLHSLYVPNGPLAAFQQIGETGIRRVQSTMSGPNQLGVWLLVPLSVALVRVLDRRISNIEYRNRRISIFHIPIFLYSTALLFTFSRAAWIGAMVLFGLTLWPYFRNLSTRIRLGLVASGLSLFILTVAAFPSVFLRIASSRGHIENPVKAVQTIVEHPLGLGLGTAGPATNRTSDSCVFLEEGSDASWATDRSDLCVFVGEKQVQPINRQCSCPFLPENWYLQIGVEMGWLGLVFYLVLMALVGFALYRATSYELPATNNSRSPKPVAFNLFVALFTTALFLHSFEDAAVAYTLWILVAIHLSAIESRN